MTERIFSKRSGMGKTVNYCEREVREICASSFTFTQVRGF